MAEEKKFQPARRAVVKRSAEYRIGDFIVKMENESTVLTEPTGAYLNLNPDYLNIPVGDEEKVIQLLRWVQEERARWSVLEQSDKAGI